MCPQLPYVSSYESYCYRSRRRQLWRCRSRCVLLLCAAIEAAAVYCYRSRQRQLWRCKRRIYIQVAPAAGGGSCGGAKVTQRTWSYTCVRSLLYVSLYYWYCYVSRRRRLRRCKRRSRAWMLRRSAQRSLRSASQVHTYMRVRMLLYIHVHTYMRVRMLLYAERKRVAELEKRLAGAYVSACSYIGTCVSAC